MSHALYSNMPTPALLAADISAAATTITLQAGGAARLPTITAGNYIWATLFHITGVHGANTEIVKVTAVSGEDLTVTRGQQGTTAEAFYLGDKLEIRVTADGLEEFATLDGATFTGPVAADVTGDLTGNVTGDLTGNVTGDLTGNVTGDLVQPITAWTRATTTTLETTSNGTLSDTGATIGAFNGVAGVTYHIRILGAGTITNSAGLIITQGLADITTAAGDTCDVEMITATTSRVKNYVRASGVVTKFVSSQQTITSAGALTLAHGLSAVPDLVMVKLVCQTAEGGYSIGDVVFAENAQQSSSASDNLGTSITVDATNINVRYGANATTFQLLNKTTGNPVGVTNANWKAVFIGVVI